MRWIEAGWAVALGLKLIGNLRWLARSVDVMPLIPGPIMRFAKIALLGLLVLHCSMAFGQNSHQWSSISYPKLPTEFASGVASPTIRCAEDGIQFSLAFSWSKDDEKKDAFKRPNGSDIKLRLHYNDKKIVEPRDSTFDGELMTFGRRGYSSGSFSCTFPWSANEMLAGWLQVTTGNKDYWLEIPYGFTRNPSTRILPTSRDGAPKFPPALRPFPEQSHIVNWKHVHYDLGEIQNAWRLSLLHANPFDAKSEVVLYRDDSAVGKSMFLWDLHDPKTKLSIKHENGFNLTSRAMSIRLHDDGMRRSDSFEFNRNPGNDTLRDWGTMAIEVGDKKWKTTCGKPKG